MTRSPSPTVETSNDPAPVPQRWEDADGLVNYTSTVPTDGGWAKLQWNADKVLVIDILAESGYKYAVKQESDTRLSVSFESAAKTTQITAWWDDDRPKLDVDNGNG
ncbi:hypothetical protein [Cryptosporangium arvum]|uniref:hypothetical protein n=1 Tax=Cryptosporangium arvum TaxID=80871 RepID=UPI0004B0E2FB|nr:hypothetical protein [Cryptosporangium arvum]